MFKGQKVKVIDCDISNAVGMTGTVAKMQNDRVLVDFGKSYSWTHQGDDDLEEPTGYWIRNEYLEAIIDKRLKSIEFKAGTSVSDYVKRILKVESDKERLKQLRTFDNCILPDKVKDLIDEAITIVLRAEKFNEWGLNDQYEKGITNAILLYGPPGTGKTMIGESIFAVLGMNIIKLDSGVVQSNIPGETERNIEKAFKEAKKSNCGILLDECDSLLYNRNSVGSILSSEINKLLTELERFDGVVVLTTNRLHKLDPALLRRILAKVGLESPDEKARKLIWDKLIPKKMPVEKLDFKELANAELTGGEIKNAILLAARKAIAKNKDLVTMDDFRSAIISILESQEDLRMFNHRFMEIKLPKPEVCNNWTPVIENGVMKCSCGRELIKIDEDTYMCSAGFPRYRFKNGEIRIDKFGNLMFKEKEHK